MLANPTQVNYYKGLGATTPSSATSIASTAAAGAAATGSIISALGISAAAGPIGIGIAAAVSIGLAIANMFQGCGQTCTETTAIVNQAEPLFQQNVAAYLAIPTGQRTVSIQKAYLNNFQTLWNGLQQACGNAAYGQAGVNCIADRGQGDCHYQTSPPIGWTQTNGVWSYTGGGPLGSGTSCWNWWVGYRDPIATDPTVVPDSVIQSTTNGTSNILSSVTNSVNNVTNSSFPWIPLIAIVAGVFFLMAEE
jgi:hypothetical protein